MYQIQNTKIQLAPAIPGFHSRTKIQNTKTSNKLKTIIDGYNHPTKFNSTRIKYRKDKHFKYKFGATVPIGFISWYGIGISSNKISKDREPSEHLKNCKMVITYRHHFLNHHHHHHHHCID